MFFHKSFFSKHRFSKHRFSKKNGQNLIIFNFSSAQGNRRVHMPRNSSDRSSRSKKVERRPRHSRVSAKKRTRKGKRSSTKNRRSIFEGAKDVHMMLKDGLRKFQHLERTFHTFLDSWSQPTSDDVSEGKESGNGEEESKSRESSDSEGYVTRKEFKRWKDSFILFLDRLIETPAAASSTMHPARSMSVGQRMAIIGQLANPNRATRPFFCIPPPPKKLHHSKGLTPKCGKWGHPFAKDLS